jgi:hypothetical protein
VKGLPSGLRWKWRISAGEFAGQIVSCVTGSAPGPENACSKVLAALIGRALKAGEAIDPDVCWGRQYLLVLAAGKEGGVRVEACVGV